MITASWSALEHAMLTLPPHIDFIPDDAARWLAMAASVASSDGVYTLDDLGREPAPDDLPDTLHRALHHVLAGSGVYTLDDLRAELRELTLTDGYMNGPECTDGQDDGDCPCRECVTKRQERNARIQAHLAERAAERARVRAASNYALVTIDQIRVYLPDGLDIQDEDAVQAWVRSHIYRVREAAQECDARDITVSDVRKAAV